MPPVTLKILLRAVASAAVVALLSLLLLEFLVRVFMPQEAPSLWLTPEPRYGHLMKPDFHQAYPFPGSDFVMDVQTNSLGFRDAEPPPRQPGVPTVLFVGDSFTFGHGVQVSERFDTLAAAKLREAAMPTRCLNLGVNAWGTLQETLYLQDHLAELAPDAIVLTFCENDPTDDTYFLQHGISFDRVRFPGKDFLRAHCHLFRLAQHLYLVARKQQTFAAQAEAAKPELDAKQQAQDARAAAEQVPVAAFAPPVAEADWQRTEGYLRDFMTAFQAQNPAGRLLIQATDPLNPDIATHLSALAQRLPNTTYVDLAPAASQLSLPQRRLPYDGHWSQAMHQISADALAKELNLHAGR